MPRFHTWAGHETPRYVIPTNVALGLTPGKEKRNMKYHKKIRLEGDIYKAVGSPCFITIRIRENKNIFLNKLLANAFLDLLKMYCRENDVLVYAYCIMPDHIHLLMSASEKKDIISFVREIKSLFTQIAWSNDYHGVIWQRSFYDHFLRNDEDQNKVANYILQNPVRKGIVTDWREYQFCGSLVYEL